MHFYSFIAVCYTRIYSWSAWISSIKRNEAIPAFLFLLYLIFSWVSYSSSTCPNLSMYLIFCDGNAATSLPRNPKVQSSVPSFLMMTALIVSNSMPEISSPTVSLNLITSSLFNAFPQHSCCSHERPLLWAFRPSNSPSRRLLIVECVLDIIHILCAGSTSSTGIL